MLNYLITHSTLKKNDNIRPIHECSETVAKIALQLLQNSLPVLAK